MSQFLFIYLFYHKPISKKYMRVPRGGDENQ